MEDIIGTIPNDHVSIDDMASVLITNAAKYLDNDHKALNFGITMSDEIEDINEDTVFKACFSVITPAVGDVHYLVSTEIHIPLDINLMLSKLSMECVFLTGGTSKYCSDALKCRIITNPLLEILGGMTSVMETTFKDRSLLGEPLYKLFQDGVMS